MNTTPLSLLLTATLLPVLAVAQSATSQHRVVAAPKAQLSTLAVLAEVGQRAAFQMSDGHTWVVEGRGRQLRVRHGGHAVHFLRPDGAGHFVSVDRRVSLHMTRDVRGAAVLSLSYPAPVFD